METLTRHLSLVATTPVSSTFFSSFAEAADGLVRLIFPSASVAVRLVDKAAIQRLNCEFRGVDKPTDVLSFPVMQLSSPMTRHARGALTGQAGDIAINFHAVRSQAAGHGQSNLAEACALLAHGLLHLAGYDHRTDAEQSEMDDLTRDLCRKVGVEVGRFGH